MDLTDSSAWKRTGTFDLVSEITDQGNNGTKGTLVPREHWYQGNTGTLWEATSLSIETTFDPVFLFRDIYSIYSFLENVYTVWGVKVLVNTPEPVFIGVADLGSGFTLSIHYNLKMQYCGNLPAQR